MPANRFYLDSPFHKGATVILEGPEHHHLSRVMRLPAGAEVEIVNGKGDLARARIESIGKTTALMLEEVDRTSPPTPISLAIPLMRPSKLEWTLEKATELGASAFFLYAADHSEKEQLSSHQIERLRTIVISALKQSGRLYLPSINLYPSLESLFKTEAQILFGEPNGQKIPAASGPILLITGPEKGFSEKERILLSKRGTGVALSPYILRAETAPIAGISILMMQI